MGYIADMMFNIALAQEAELQSLFENNQWETSNGQIWDIPSMTDQHIRNCIRCIEQKRIDLGGWEADYIKKFTSELQDRHNAKCVDVS